MTHKHQTVYLLLLIAALVSGCSSPELEAEVYDALEHVRVACIYGEGWTDPDLGPDPVWDTRAYPIADAEITAAEIAYDRALWSRDGRDWDPLYAIPVHEVRTALSLMHDGWVTNDDRLFLNGALLLPDVCDRNDELCVDDG